MGCAGAYSPSFRIISFSITLALCLCLPVTLPSLLQLINISWFSNILTNPSPTFCFNFSRSLCSLTWALSPALLGFFYLLLHGIGYFSCLDLLFVCLWLPSVQSFRGFSTLPWRSNHKYQFYLPQLFEYQLSLNLLKGLNFKKFYENRSLNVIF